MAINLSRNTLVYFTTNVNAAGEVVDSGSTSSNTFQIQVLDGYSFSQATTQSTIQISEAGDAPSRGQRAFNTALNPVDFTFSTYIRPVLTTGTAGPVTAAEKVLWNALLGQNKLDTVGKAISSIARVTTGDGAGTSATSGPFATIALASALTKISNDSTSAVALVVGDIINVTGIANEASFNQPAKITHMASAVASTYTVEFAIAPAATATATIGTSMAYSGQWAQGSTATTSATNHSYVSTMGSGKNQLQKFGMIFVVDNVTYAVDNCAMDQVSIDFGLDAIAMAAWTGKGTKLKTLANPITAAAAVTTAGYITNKLSTMALVSKINGADASAGISYTIPITGGNVTIANNIAYQTPTNLAVVNVPIGYYTGQRSITGNVTAYLRTGGSNDSGTLLTTLLAAATTSAGVEPKYKVQLELGGKNAGNKVEFEMPAVVLQIPAVNVADVVATTINFNAQGFTSDTSLQTYDITNNNDLIVRYYSNTNPSA